MVGPRDGAGRRPEVQAAGVHPLSSARPAAALWRTKNALAPEPVLEADLGRDPDERDRLDRRRPERRRPARRSTSAPVKGTPAATARPASASTRRPTTARTGPRRRLVRRREQPLDHVGRDRAGQREPHPDRHALGHARRSARTRRSVGTVAAQSPAVGVYNSTDGGATFALAAGRLDQRGQVRPERSEHRLRRAGATVGLIRSTTGGAARAPGRRSSPATAAASRSRRCGCRTARRASTSPTRAAAAQRRSGLPHRRREPAGGDDDRASSNAAWTRLSNPTEGTPGFAVYNYCNTPLVGSQCTYDMFIMSPADRPDMVVVGGLMHYEELKPYASTRAACARTAAPC